MVDRRGSINAPFRSASGGRSFGISVCFFLGRSDHHINGVGDLQLGNTAAVGGLLLLSGEALIDRLARLVVGDGLCFGLGVDADEVIAELGLDGGRNGACLQREGGLLKLGHHLPTAELTEVTGITENIAKNIMDYFNEN